MSTKFRRISSPEFAYPGEVIEYAIVIGGRTVGEVEGAKGEGFTAELHDGRRGHGATRVSAVKAAQESTPKGTS